MCYIKVSSLILFICVAFFSTLFSQVKEKIDRGVVALTIDEGKVYVGWRLLKDDPEDDALLHAV